MFRIAVWAALAASSLLAYQVGEAVEPALLEKMGLQDEKRAYVVDFFASWCHTCRRESPKIAKLHGTEAEGVTIEVVGVDVDRSVEEGRRFVQNVLRRNGETFRVIEDPEGAIVSRFDPPGIPAVYVLYQGKVLGRFVGATSDIGARIAACLKGRR